ncbi:MULTISPECIES: SDR family oxidoreductase [Nocardia]|uniref:SDR family oxidoreductase n=1 Tax=Nocardia abscessus TaxID=120957 RepID=UPI001893FDED|nr:SDR family oxidoreductase [Nocardia abscessus]MBF6471138.1 SDR family oxidoreductase [Nocardia abscessus]
MKIVVIGGTGLIGSKLVARLGEHGHQAVPAAPNTGVNSITGEGVKEALQDANVVIDVSNSPSFADNDVMEFFRTSTTNLLEAAAAAGVGHYVALSVVGSERLPDSGYLRAKVAQEELIEGSGLPYSIVRATQFFEFAGGIADSATVDGQVRLPGSSVQPIAADDVAAAVGRTAAGEPKNGTIETGGPEVIALDEWIRTVLSARSDARTVVTDPEARYFGAVPQRELLPGSDAQLAQTRLSEWLTSN